jgi:sporadic carbohydrate cluster protein (TIGR04323 family)
MKKVKGYIFSRSFMGERVPQHIQNIVIRDYCKKNELQYLLSTSEYNMNNSFLILNNLVTNLKGINGIIAYSLFQLPYYQGERNKILKKIIKKKKFIMFASEKMKVSNLNELNHINSIWKIKKTLPYCPSRI